MLKSNEMIDMNQQCRNLKFKLLLVTSEKFYWEWGRICDSLTFLRMSGIGWIVFGCSAE